MFATDSDFSSTSVEERQQGNLCVEIPLKLETPELLEL